MRVEGDRLREFGRASGLEWLETNGRGGYAAGTVAGANTRKYHGLLVAALQAPVRRHVLLSAVDAAVHDGGEVAELSSHVRRDGRIEPDGWSRLQSFRMDPWPVSIVEALGRRVQRSVFLVHGEDTVVLRWDLLEGAPCDLVLRPLLAFRDHHHVRAEDGGFERRVEDANGIATLRPLPGMPALRVRHDGALHPEGSWRTGIVYPVETARGEADEEDLFGPFRVTRTLRPGEPVFLVFTLDGDPARDPAALEATERARRQAVIAGARAKIPGLPPALAAAADQFLVRRADGTPTVIAGYPWFTDWGRDTFLSLPGLLLATGRHDEARDVLLGFAKHLDRGMIPNRFPDSGEAPEYGTVDGTLWFVHAAGRWVRATLDLDTAALHLVPAFRSILLHHRRGTRFGIRVDRDGLLAAGETGMQLTWMDARVDGRVITPRHGKAVEVNALWIEALETIAAISMHAGDRELAADAHDHLRVARESFAQRFWYAKGNHLFDVVDGPHGDDPSLRPNQILAVSLPHPAVDGDRARAVVEAVFRELLTPFGLRTLAPSHPDYRPRYEGDLRARDAAYHQGTVWPWLLGPFVRAWLKTQGKSPLALASARALLDPVSSHLENDGCLGQIAEVFDAEPPQRPLGCFAQAWNVAELIRLHAEDLRE